LAIRQHFDRAEAKNPHGAVNGLCRLATADPKELRACGM
jgi:hypothetical protein